ncbi:MAG: AIR synthase-related protein, partial [Pseudomonadota bacterium]
RAAHDLSDGGLALGAAEMALAAGCGIALDPADGMEPLAWFFGEDQGRYLIAVEPSDAGDAHGMARRAGVAAAAVGRVGGDVIALGREHLPLARLADAHCTALPSLVGEH